MSGSGGGSSAAPQLSIQAPTASRLTKRPRSASSTAASITRSNPSCASSIGTTNGADMTILVGAMKRTSQSKRSAPAGKRRPYPSFFNR